MRPRPPVPPKEMRRHSHRPIGPPLVTPPARLLNFFFVPFKTFFFFVSVCPAGATKKTTRRVRAKLPVRRIANCRRGASGPNATRVAGRACRSGRERYGSCLIHFWAHQTFPAAAAVGAADYYGRRIVITPRAGRYFPMQMRTGGIIISFHRGTGGLLSIETLKRKKK